MTLDVSKLKASLVMAEYMGETDYYALYHIYTPIMWSYRIFYLGEDCKLKTEVVTTTNSADWREVMRFVRKMTKKFQTKEQAEDFLKKIIRKSKISKAYQVCS